MFRLMAKTRQAPLKEDERLWRHCGDQLPMLLESIREFNASVIGKVRPLLQWRRKPIESLNTRMQILKNDRSYVII